MSPRQPSGAFHMRTRRRTAQPPTPPSSIPPSSSSPEAASPRPATPERSVKSDRGSASSLSSPPSSLGRTPEGLGETNSGSSKQRTNRSPVRESAGKRKAETEVEADKVTKSGPQKLSTRSLKQQKIAPEGEPILRIPLERRALRTIKRKSPEKREQDLPPSRKPWRKRKLSDERSVAENPTPSSENDDAAPRRVRKPKVQFDGSPSAKERSSAEKQDSDKSSAKENSKADEEDDFDFSKHKGEVLWPEYKPNRPIYYGVDAEIRYKASSHRGNSAAGSPRRNGRGGGGGRGRGGAVSNGAGRGKGRPRGGGRAGRGGGGTGGGDSPERKRTLSPGAQDSLAILKKRQQELQGFFKVVGSQQIEILDQIAARDLNKLVRKSKAHQQVPEYNGVFEDLVEGMKDAVLLAQKKKETQVAYEEGRFEREKELIETKFATQMENIRQEYLRGVQGEIILKDEFRKTIEDDTRTETGSEINYFPQYHTLPEPNQSIRGYNSTRITDEAPFKLQLSAYEDQARREVLDDDVLAPIARELIAKNQARKDDEERKKTQTMEALSEEASKQLKEMKGYLIPRPLQPSEQSAYALSALADMSEWVAQKHPHRQYIYMPLAPGDSFPRNALNYDPLPGTSAQMASPAMVTSGPQNHRQGYPQPQPQPQQHQRRPPPSTSNVRGRPQQQQPGQQQFVFQPPHTQHIYPHPPPQSPFGMGQVQNQAQAHAHPHSHGQAPARVPVTFVNQTVQSRKASGAAAAAGVAGGKGQPRMLLPKMV